MCDQPWIPTQEEVETFRRDPNEEITSFLMVVIEVSEELQTVTLNSVHDGEPPATMEWHYGLAPVDLTGCIDDKVGECYRVTLEKLP